jgi:hypothetical protein
MRMLGQQRIAKAISAASARTSRRAISPEQIMAFEPAAAVLPHAVPRAN